MAQYKTGTVAVTNGSATVTGSGTAWASNLQPGDGFTVASTGVAYDVAQVVSDTELKLSAPYSGAAGSGLAYSAWRDFTAPYNIPEMSQGDIETATVFTRAMRKINEALLLTKGAAVDATNDARDQAEAARDIALASANFKGRWGDLTGAVSVPASVYHDGYYWILLDNLADVTAEAPGASVSWAHIYLGDGLPFGPGPQVLVAGDMTAGYFGEVSSDELFSGDELALITGVTEGESVYSDAGWLKFVHNNKIKYIAKKSFRHSVTWDHLYSRGLVYGTDDNGKAPRGAPANQMVKVSRSGSEFIVRMMTGASADPYPESDPLFFTDDMYQMDVGGGSEWNELMYRVCADVPSDPATDGMTANRHGGPQAGANWAGISSNELGITTGYGRYAWCQEQSDTTSAYRVIRGYHDLAGFNRLTGSYGGTNYGWRPALELVTNN